MGAKMLYSFKGKVKDLVDDIQDEMDLENNIETLEVTLGEKQLIIRGDKDFIIDELIRALDTVRDEYLSYIGMTEDNLVQALLKEDFDVK